MRTGACGASLATVCCVWALCTWCTSLLTLGMVRWSGSAGLSTEAGTAILESTELGNTALVANALSFAPQAYVVGFMPVFEFSPQLIPQGWSIGVELVCYLLAPLVVLSTRRHPRRLWIWLAAGLGLFAVAVWTAGLDFDLFNSVVYKNAFASVVVFLAGGAFYYLRRRRGQPVPFSVVGVLLAVWVATLTVRAFRLGEGPSARVFTEYVWLTVAMTGLVATTRVERLRRLDTALGNLCYGVYLNHFLVAGLLLGTGAERYVSRPGTLTFGFVVLAGSLALALLTYYSSSARSTTCDNVFEVWRHLTHCNRSPILDAHGWPSPPWPPRWSC